jgi:hypothetical protein
MLEIIALIFLTKKMGALAIDKGLKSGTWKLYTVLAWIGGEIVGIIIGLSIFGQENLFPVVLLGLGCAFTGYYIVNVTLSKKPDVFDDIDSIGQ